MNRHRRSGRALAFIVGAVVGIILLVIVGVVGLGAWGWSEIKNQARAALNRNPVILEHVGSVSEIDLDLTATGEQAGADVFVFDVVGEKSTGVVTAELVTVDAETEEIRSGTLRLPSGETYDLIPEAQSSGNEEEGG